MGHEEANRIEAAERYLLGELSDAERDQFEEHFFGCRACAEDVRAGAIFEANARAVLAEKRPRPTAKPGRWEWLCVRPAFAGSLAGVVGLLAGGLSYVVVAREPSLLYKPAVVTRQIGAELAELWEPQPQPDLLLKASSRTSVAERRDYLPEQRQTFSRELAALRAPQSFPLFFLRSATRGAEQVIEVPRESGFLGMSLDLPPGQSFGQYLGEVLSEPGAILFSVPLAKPRTPGDPLNLLIPASSLELGRRYTLILRGLEGASTAQPGIEIARYPFVTQGNTSRPPDVLESGSHALLNDSLDSRLQERGR